MQAIRKTSLAEQVAGRLKEAITGGRYELNERFPSEPELMKTFGVGRSTVREAIRILVNSGFLRVQQGMGTFVASLKGRESLDKRLERADISDLIEVRELLEMKIVEKAAAERTAQDLERLEHMLSERKRFAAAGEVAECIKADIGFHLALAEASGNEILFDIYRAASEHLMQWFFRKHHDTVQFTETQELHEELYRRVKAKDPEGAREVAARIIGHI